MEGRGGLVNSTMAYVETWRISGGGMRRTCDLGYYLFLAVAEGKVARVLFSSFSLRGPVLTDFFFSFFSFRLFW